MTCRIVWICQQVRQWWFRLASLNIEQLGADRDRHLFLTVECVVEFLNLRPMVYLLACAGVA